MAQTLSPGQAVQVLRVIAACLASTSVGACGGRAVRDDRSTADPSAGSGARPEGEPSSTAGGSSLPGVTPVPTATVPSPTPVCGIPPSPLRAEIVWQATLGQRSGLHGGGMFGFSPDGERLVTPPDEYSIEGYREFSTVDGSMLRQSQAPVLARDQHWRRELRGDWSWSSMPDFSVVELPTELPLLEFERFPQPAALSADGEMVFTLRCEDGPLIERRRVATGEVDTLRPAPGSSCLEPYTYGGEPIVATSSGDAALFTLETGELWIANFEDGTSRSRAMYPAPVLYSPDWPPLNAILTLALSPQNNFLAIAAAGQPLRVWSYPDLTRVLPDIPVSYLPAFSSCYCSPRAFVPIAWSRDDRWLAAPDEAGNVAIRRTCDGALLATVPKSVEAAPEGEASGPALLAFAPSGDGLAVFGGVGDALASHVAYYRITE